MTRRSRRRRKQRRGHRGRSARDRLQTALVVIVLLGVGVLLGSFWLEWRQAGVPETGSVSDAAASPSTALEDRPRVEVLNGAGDPGAAKEVASYLRSRGFDVVYFGNAAHFDNLLTEVLDRSGRPAAAQNIARALGLDSAQARVDPELYLDATVVLGKDWRERLSTALR